MSDLIKTINTLSIDEDNVILTINNVKIKINKNKFNQDEINNIINKNYCPGCKDISTKGYFGSKSSWCSLSRKLSNYI